MIKNKIVKNAGWIIGCKIVQSVLALIVSMLTARFLGPSGFGVINYAASVVAFAVPIMQLGVNAVLVQEIVTDPKREGEAIGSAVTMCFTSSLLCILGVVAFASIVNAGERETIIVCGLYSLILIAQAFEMIQYWFQAKYLSKYTSVIMLIAYALVTAYKIFLLISKKSVYWFAISYAIDYSIIAIGLFIVYKKLGTQKLRFSFDMAKHLFSKGKYYIVSSMMVTIFAQTDKVMLKLMMGDEFVGYYSAAVTCAGMTSFVFTAIIDSMRPMIFESKKTDNSAFEKNVSRLYCLIIYLSLAQSVVMTLFAPLIVNILYGVEYQSSIGTLQILVWYTTFSYMGAVRDIWILGENKQRYLWILNLGGATVNIALNFALIPIMGVNGAALASLITQAFTNIVMNVIVWPLRHNNKLVLQGLNPMLVLKLLNRGKKK